MLDLIQIEVDIARYPSTCYISMLEMMIPLLGISYEYRVSKKAS